MVAEHIMLFASGFFTALFLLLGLWATCDRTTFKSWWPKTRVRIPGFSPVFVVVGRRDENDYIELKMELCEQIYADPQILVEEESK